MAMRMRHHAAAVLRQCAARAAAPSTATTTTATRSLSAAATGPLGSAAGEPQKRVLYDTHMPTSPVQKVFLSVFSALSVFADPERGDMLASLGEVTGAIRGHILWRSWKESGALTACRDALRQVHAKMCSDPVGVRILTERPSIRSDRIDMTYLRALPKHTFGYVYSQFMDSHGFEADGRAYVKYVDDEELAYVMKRHRELHDFWHVLFGLPPTVFGEIALKYVELLQTKLPVCALSGFVGPLRLTSGELTRWLAAVEGDQTELTCVSFVLDIAEERRVLVRDYIPWANRAGRNAHFLLNVMYEEEFETPLEELRQRLRIEVAPPAPPRV
ncbi:Ubiquinone biosynthesis protein coq4, partial [Globisporangium splendens]